MEKLKEILVLNPNIKLLLTKLKFPNNFPWYLVAGCINQTIWNYLTNRDITYGIGDYDLIYWDDDISNSAEKNVQENIRKQFPDINLEIINQARVYTWYKEDFGVEIPQYKCMEDAIKSWPSTAACIGVTNKNGKILVYAPFGLDDIFGLKLRYNPTTTIPTEKVWEKVNKWVSKWPELQIVENSYPTSEK